MISAREALMITGEKFPSIEITYPTRREVVLMPEHPKIKSMFKDYCYVVVHPGFSHQKKYMNCFSYDGKNYFREFISREDHYGSHSEYSSNMKSFIKSLGQTNEPSLFLIGVDSKKAYPRGYLPPKRSFMLLTEDSDARLLGRIRTSDGSIVNLDQGRICSYLKDNGVKEVRMAGEFTWWDDGLGCVRRAAKEFELEGFDIKGVKNCLYPSMPPGKHSYYRDYKDITRKLFEDQAEFPF